MDGPRPAEGEALDATHCGRLQLDVLVDLPTCCHLLDVAIHLAVPDMLGDTGCSLTLSKVNGSVNGQSMVNEYFISVKKTPH